VQCRAQRLESGLHPNGKPVLIAPRQRGMAQYAAITTSRSWIGAGTPSGMSGTLCSSWETSRRRLARQAADRPHLRDESGQDRLQLPCRSACCRRRTARLRAHRAPRSEPVMESWPSFERKDSSTKTSRAPDWVGKERVVDRGLVNFPLASGPSWPPRFRGGMNCGGSR